MTRVTFIGPYRAVPAKWRAQEASVVDRGRRPNPRMQPTGASEPVQERVACS